MSRSTVLRIAAVAVALGLGMLVIVAREDSRAMIAARFSPAASPGEQAQRERRREEAGSAQAASDRPRDGFDLLARAQRAGDAYQPLLVAARAGDVSALMALNKLVGYCYFVFDDPRRAPRNDSDPGSAVYRLREVALQRRRAFCNDEVGHRGAVAYLADYQTMMEAAAESGDELAIASQLFLAREQLSPEGVELAIEIGRETRSPEVLADIILALAASGDPRIQAIERRVFHELQPRAERDLVIARAATWAACTQGGADCGPDNREAESDCIYFGECHPQLSRMEYIRRYALSAQHFAQMQRYLALLEREVLKRR